MVRYISVGEEQVPIGRTALLLFVHRGQLCAGLLEHRCDGRVVRRLPDDPKTADLIPVIRSLMNGSDLDGDLHVVIEGDAYWPEAFPALSLSK